jgi:hypothetical protein
MERAGSLPCSQEPSTGPYSEHSSEYSLFAIVTTFYVVVLVVAVVSAAYIENNKTWHKQQ